MRPRSIPRHRNRRLTSQPTARHRGQARPGTQVYLRDEELEALHSVAERLGRSVAELVREAIRRVWLRPDTQGPWEQLLGAGVRFHTSMSVVLETFTFLDRNAARDVALAWKDSLTTLPRLKVLPASVKDLEQAWSYFERPDLHQLSAVDAVSFVLMAQRRIRVAFAFDSQFSTAGFRMVG